MTGELAWQIGDITVTRVEELIADVPAEYLVTGATPDVVDAHRPWVDPFFTPDGELRLSIHSFVVATPTTTIVVDTCVGVHRDRSLHGDGTFLDRLAGHIAGGLEGVDVVVCTHLHFDHIGWNTIADSDGVMRPAFPRARYLITADELADFVQRDETQLAATGIDPIRAAHQLDPVSTTHLICDGVHLLPTPGHTPGHVSVLIESSGSSALITGDAVHSPIQFARPELAATRFDSDSAASTATRHDLVRRFVDTDTLILGTHFAPPTAGNLRRNAEGACWFDITRTSSSP